VALYGTTALWSDDARGLAWDAAAGRSMLNGLVLLPLLSASFWYGDVGNSTMLHPFGGGI
jgi:hypothetical protein